MTPILITVENMSMMQLESIVLYPMLHGKLISDNRP
jgi:hypothetical protein